MTHRVLSGARKLLLVSSGVVVATGPSIRAQSASSVPAIAATAPRPRFEVVSIKPNGACAGQSGRIQITAGRLRMTCQTVFSLINRAYGMYPDGRYDPHFVFVQVEGGPGWINSDSDRFDLDAKPEDAATGEIMQGPMLQAFLEDRLKLRIHRETRDIPLYQLSVAKGGVKMERVEEGSCVLVDSNSKPAATDPRPACGQGSMGRSGPNNEIQEMNFRALSMDELLGVLRRFPDRPVTDRTGLAGRFNLRLQFARDLSASDTAAPSIFTALQEQLGLKLEPAKGPGEFLVVDSIERPTQN